MDSSKDLFVQRDSYTGAQELARAKVNIQNRAGLVGVLGGAHRLAPCCRYSCGEREQPRIPSLPPDEHRWRFLSPQYGLMSALNCYPDMGLKGFGLQWPGGTACSLTPWELEREHCKFKTGLIYIARLSEEKGISSCSKLTTAERVAARNWPAHFSNDLKN